MCRTPKEISESEKNKIALFCNVPIENVIPAFDVENIYQILLNYHKENLDTCLLKSFNIKDVREPNLTKWRDVIEKMSKKKLEITIAIVGKYSLKGLIYLFS